MTILPFMTFTFLAANVTINDKRIVLQNTSLTGCARDCVNSICVGFGYRAATSTCYRLAHINKNCSICDAQANLYTFATGRRCYERRYDYSRWGNVCYNSEDTTAMWSEAKTMCEEKGGFLFEVTSDDLHDFFRIIVHSDTAGGSVWIGGHCVMKVINPLQDVADALDPLCVFTPIDPCTWQWSRYNTSMNVMRWLPGQPDFPCHTCLSYQENEGLYQWDNIMCNDDTSVLYCQYDG